MNWPYYVSVAGATSSIVIAVWVFVHRKRPFLHWSFALGMSALAAERVLWILTSEAVSPSEAIYWQNFRLIVAGLLPGAWLTFSLRYARENYEDLLQRWKGVIVATWALPLIFSILLSRYCIEGVNYLDTDLTWRFSLGWAGRAYEIGLLLAYVLILVNFERTIRASSGGMRWQIKFTILGLCVLFAFRIYSSSQAWLFSSLDTILATADAGALVMANLLITIALFRSRTRFAEIYVSQDFLYNSITMTVVGLYLIAVAVLAAVSRYFNIDSMLFGNGFFVFLIGLGASILLLSEQVRYAIRRFVSHHFHRPLYDYRKVWTDFTKQVVFHGEIKATCTSVARMVSLTTGVSAVSIWLLDETRGQPILCGSSSLSPSSLDHFEELEKVISYMMLTMREHELPIDLDRNDRHPSGSPDTSLLQGFINKEIRYCVPLRASEEFLGIMTLNNRAGDESLAIEDLELIKVISDQASGIFLSQRLFERLKSAKEMEAFQTLSAFFIHDLKNLASTLSLTLQNLPVHYENPEFRKDAMNVIASTTGKIKSMCSRLSGMNRDFRLNCVECDINELVLSTLGSLNGALTCAVSEDLKTVPKTFIDPEQLQTVLINLLKNADEAQTQGGEISIKTSQEKQCVVLSVSDKGCGMSRDFITHSLFHPFSTTKKKGLGIGLYQCKMIVQAHQGTIDVESENGKGTTFRIVLPLERKL